MTECVLVTDKEFVKAKSIFESAKGFMVKSAPTEETALAEAILSNNCRAVIIGVEKYTGPLYEVLQKTGRAKGATIARYGVGHDGVDKALAARHNIIVSNTPGVLDISVAELAIWLMGTLARNVAKLDAEIRSGRFSPQMGMELAGKTLGIIGFGAIGKRVAKIAGLGLDLKVIAADMIELNSAEIGKLKKDFGIKKYTNDVNVVLSQADIISLHLPSIPQTHHFINSEKLSTMKQGAMLINTSRGTVVDESALYDALINHWLSAAALDVFQQEPYVPVHPDKDLRTLDHIVLTPHIASNTRQANNRIAAVCLGNIENFFSGQTDELNQVKH